jgi:glucose/arabinose dehydrogenase
MFRIPFLAAGLALAASAIPSPARAAAPINLVNAFPGLKFNRPVYVGEIPGMPARTFVVLEQFEGLASTAVRQGNAWVKGTLLKLDVHQAAEMGLLGIAFHPRFRENGRYFVCYNPAGGMQDVLEERAADPATLKDKGVAKRLIALADKYDNHNAGTLGFGPKDGMLYWSMGDGGAAYDPDGNGQNRKVLFGKMIRLDVDRRDPGLEYAIPADNPFAADPDPAVRREIWAYGLRNPWKWSFDRLTGDLWAGDVGQNEIEEVDLIRKGGNYGWDAMEGPAGKNDGTMILPVHSYKHGNGTCVIGGYVYRGDAKSPWYGTYFYTDETAHDIRVLRKAGDGTYASESLTIGPGNFTSMGEDAEGRLYVCGLTTQTVYLLDSPELGGGALPVGLARRPAAERYPRDVAALLRGFRLTGARSGRAGAPGAR